MAFWNPEVRGDELSSTLVRAIGVPAREGRGGGVPVPPPVNRSSLGLDAEPL